MTTIKASSQTDLIDLTDGYSVMLSNENHTFQGDTDSVASTQTITTTVVALCGSEQVPATIGAITGTTGITAVSDGKTPVPTITITATSALTKPGTLTIPVTVGDGVTIDKTFSYAIAFKGATGSQGIQGLQGKDGTQGIQGPTGKTGAAGANGASAYTHIAYADDDKGTGFDQEPGSHTYVGMYADNTATDSTDATKYGWSLIKGAKGDTGTPGKAGADGKTPYFHTAWATAADGSAGFSTTESAGKTYIGTYTDFTSADSTTASTYSWVKMKGDKGDTGATGAKGATGANGADALQLIIISSGGTIFKNTAIATTMTAHVYKGPAEVTGTALTGLGTIKWYKDGAATAVATGQTLTVKAGDVASKATYTAQLEG
jgi:hypothetical protein